MGAVQLLDARNDHRSLVAIVMAGFSDHVKTATMSLSERAEQQGRYDSAVANAGQMARHPYGQQIHREFIVYNRAKVYPEYLATFRV